MSEGFKMPALFVGGPKDGERRWVDPAQRIIRVAKPQRPFNFGAMILDTMKADDTFTVDIVSYRRESWRCPGCEVLIYVPEDWTVAHMLEAVVSGYRPTTKNGEIDE